MKAQSIWNLFPEEWRDFFKAVSFRQEKIQEIRLRVGCPVYVIEDGRERFLDRQGQYADLPERAKFLTAEELKSMIKQICRDSL